MPHVQATTTSNDIMTPLCSTVTIQFHDDIIHNLDYDDITMMSWVSVAMAWLGLAWLGLAKHGLTKKGQAKPSHSQTSQLVAG